MGSVARIERRSVVPRLSPKFRDFAIVVLTCLLAGGAGRLVAQGRGEQLLMAAAGLAIAVAIFLWPSAALAVWVAALLANGRELTHFQVGPLYVTEVVLGLFAFAAIAHLTYSRRRLSGLKFSVVLIVLLWVPAFAGLALRTNSIDRVSATNLAMIVASVFAFVAVVLGEATDDRARLFKAVVLGSLLALVVVFTGYGGESGATSTGAIRIAHGSFVQPFGIAAIAIITVARERLLRRRYLLLLPPFLTGLLLMNSRSAWVGFGLAVGLFLATRPTVRPRLVLVSVVAALAALFTLFNYGLISVPGATLSIERANSITDTNDPNTEYRLSFWSAVAKRSLTSPLIGGGFDAYPSEIVPRHTTFDEENPAPHNSFVALAYRVGAIPAALVFALLISLIWRGFAISRRHIDPAMRATTSALASVAVFLSVHVFFNVGLEVPYAAALFWLTFGLLAAAVYRSRGGVKTHPAQP
ncbi:MAG: O-antigen ligase family protein [Gaiellaceae bacterium]